MGTSTQGASPASLDEIEMTIIQTKGSSVIFGELGGDSYLTGSLQSFGGAASQTRGIIFNGKSSPNASRNVIEFLTLATFGNSQNFGDQLTSVSYTHLTLPTNREV